jgi:Tol biopolymer transport system component/predicted Ser/Thr protein kinase
VIGKTVSHYRILEKLGGGGMGVVYKAEDTKLGRTVALKVLPPERVADPNRKRRFVQEARAASALNHPNIITIYDIDEAEGVHYIAMEYVEGKTLDRLIARHGLRVNEALKYAVQMATALAKAHSAGIVHRDLKPTNVMVTDDGLVKVLDFGLAMLTEAAPTGDAETAVTLEPTTEEGTIVGTVGYMSPEQAEGKPVDARSDIFSFGSVLYEMLTGQRAFQGETKVSTIAAILREEPKPLSQVVEGLPREVERIVKRCLRKDPAHRVQHMDDLKLALEELKEESDSGELADTAAAVGAGLARPREGKALPYKWAALAAIVVIAAAAVIYWLTRPLPPPRVVSSVQITNDGTAKAPPIFTDGSRLYFTAAEVGLGAPCQVSVAGGRPAPIPAPIAAPYQSGGVVGMSPDGAELLVQSNQGTVSEGPLWVIPTVAGSGYRISGVTSSDASWSPDGQKMVYCRGNTLNLAKRDGSEPHQLATVPGTPSWVRFSPDERVLRFTAYDPKTNSYSLWEVASDGTNLHPLLPGWNNPPDECCGNWTPDGKYYVFQSTRNNRGDIWAIREKTRLFGSLNPEAIRLTSGPLDLSGVTPSKDGKRLFVIGSQRRGELARCDVRSGELVPYLGGISADTVDFSRDGQWMTYVAYPEGTLWRSKLDGSERLQLTFPPLTAYLPRWSPDAKHIAFQGFTPAKPWTMYMVAAEGGSLEQMATGVGDVGWTADGKSLVYSELPQLVQAGAGGKLAIRLMDLRTRQVSTLPESEGLYSPRASPDGRYIAAIRSGPEVLLVFDLAAQKWIDLTTVGVGFPSWSHDSKYVYFDTWEGNALYRVRVSDRNLERLASLKGVRRTGVVFNWSGLAPDDSFLVLRDIGTQEIYALDWEAP